MKRSLVVAVVCLLLAPVAAPAEDVTPEKLLGKWELTEMSAGIPKGSVFDFQKGGKLVVTAEIGGEKKTFDFKYELKEQTLRFIAGDKTDTTTASYNDQRDELTCRDKDGTTARFKRAK